MSKRKFNENIRYAIAVAVSVACVLVLLFHLLSDNVMANSEINSVFDLSTFTYHCHHDNCGEDNKSENEASPICSEPCNSCSRNVMMVFSSTSVYTNSNAFKKVNLFLEEQLHTEDILRSIFKPPII